MRQAIYLLIGFLLLQLTYSQTFCSAKCMYSFSGNGYSPLCTGPLETDCQACDSTFFTLDGTSCSAPNTTYTFEAIDFSPDGVLDGTWVSPNPAGIAVTTFNTSYTVINFVGNTSLSKSFAVPNAHSSIRLRMFVMIVGNPTYTFQIIVDGNVSNPISVDNSSRLYLSNTSSDSYIYTSVDIPHSGTSVALTLSVNNLSGTASSFGVKELMIFTKNCPPECTGCDKTGACTGCGLIDTTQYTLAGGKCLTYCPSGYYASVNIGVCDLCDQSCLTCSSVSFNCTSCPKNNPNTEYLYNYACVASCPTGYYNSNYVCYQCFQGCSSCNGSGKDNCQSCNWQYYLVSGSTSCELSCPPGQFIDPTYSNSCSLCDVYCATCDFASTNCRSCVTNGTYEAYLFASNNTCMQFCPNNFTGDSKTHTCVCNDSNYVSYINGYCTPCHMACRTCNGSTADNCLSCSNNYYMSVNSTSCKYVCPSGQYPDPTALRCAPCDSSCFTCSGSSSYCTGCNSGTYLMGSVCVSECPNGYMKSTLPNRCQQCEISMVSYKGTCLSVCPPGYSPVNSACYSNDLINKKKANFTTHLSIINSGTRLQIQLKFTVPMAKNSSLTHSNINVTVKSFVSRRLLESIEVLAVKNIIIDQSFTNVKILTAIPNSIDNFQLSILEVDFGQDKLFSSDGLVYKSYSGIFPLNTPSFVNDLFTNYYKSSLQGIGIFFTVVGLLLLVMSYWNKHSLYSCIQFFMMLQITHIFTFGHYPIDFKLASFFAGFSSSHFQFFPNIFNLVVTNYVQNAFDVYQFKTMDMNFLRLISPVLLYIIIFSVFVGYLYVYDKISFKKLIGWMMKVMAFTTSLNIGFSAFSSLVGLFLNHSNSNVMFIVSQMIGLVVLGGLVWYYSKRAELFKTKLFIVGDFIHCITIPLFSISLSIFLILDTVLSVAIVIYYWKKVMKKRSRKDWCILVERIIGILLLNIIVMVSNSIAMILVVSILLFICLLMTIFMYYLGIKKSRTQKKRQQQKPLPGSVPLQNTSAINAVLPSNNTLITELEQKLPQISNTPAIIYEHDLQESPGKHDVILELKPPTNRTKAVKEENIIHYEKNVQDYEHKEGSSRQLEELQESINYHELKSSYQPTLKRKIRFEKLRQKYSQSNQPKV